MTSNNMKIAVIGAGIYGCTIALKLAEGGFDIDLIEREGDVMKISSFISRRSHRGYFYPRSKKTIVSCQKNAPEFEQRYPDATLRGITTYYAIARNGSKVTGTQYLETINSCGLPYEHSKDPLLNPESTELCLAVQENYYDPSKLRKTVKERLKNSTVKLFLNTDAKNHPLDQYDLRIIATYANNNAVVSMFGNNYKQSRTYRLCEKIVVELPEAFYNKSFVVADGPFFQLEPFATERGRFVVSHFVHSVHDRRMDDSSATDPELTELLVPDSIIDRKRTHFSRIIDAASEFIPEVRKACYVSSIYAIKPVWVGAQEDARPVVVEPIRRDILTVFSGKVSGSVQAAAECLEYAQNLQKGYSVKDSKSRTVSTAV